MAPPATAMTVGILRSDEPDSNVRSLMSTAALAGLRVELAAHVADGAGFADALDLARTSEPLEDRAAIVGSSVPTPTRAMSASAPIRNVWLIFRSRTRVCLDAFAPDEEGNMEVPAVRVVGVGQGAGNIWAFDRGSSLPSAPMIWTT